MNTCLMCGIESPEIECLMLVVKEARVCPSCSEIVANAYQMKHSGRWLTWPNPPTEKPKHPKAKINGNIRIAVFERDIYRCKHCGTHKDLCCDHIIPESKGGETSLDNLQTLCRSCNSKKGVSHA